MSDKFDSFNPDDQFNSAVKLIINAYEKKTNSLENEIFKLNEELEKLTEHYKSVIMTIGNEKYLLEEKLETVVKDNHDLISQVEFLSKENKKLENFKNSIMNSINSDPTDVNLNLNEYFSSCKLDKANKINNNVNTNTNITRNMALNSNNSNSAFSRQINKFNTVNKNKNLDINISKLNDNKIETLIDRLNASINNKIYPDDVEKGNENSLYNNYTINEKVLNKKVSDIKSKINNTNTLTYNNNNHHNTSCNNNLQLETIRHPIQIESLSRGEESPSYRDTEGEKKDNSADKSKSHQYNRSSKFFSDCRASLENEEYLKLIETLKQCNNCIIDKHQAFKRIQTILECNSKNKYLLKDFKEIFPTN